MFRSEWFSCVVQEPPIATTREPVGPRNNKRLLVREAVLVCFDANPAMMARIVAEAGSVAALPAVAPLVCEYSSFLRTR